MSRRAVLQFVSSGFARLAICFAMSSCTACFGSLIAAGPGHAGIEASAPAPLLVRPASLQPGAQEATALELDRPIERELAEGQQHTYHISLSTGEYVRLEIRQLSALVRVTLIQPDGTTVHVQDMFARVPLIAIERVADSSGIYRFDVFSSTKTPTGRYEIRVTEIHPATEDERALHEANDSHYEATRFQREGKYLEARPLWRRAVEIRERVLGPEHLHMAQSLGHLANNYRLTGDYASGEPLRQRALRIKEKALGPEHPAVAEEIHALAVGYYEKGDLLKSEEMFHKAAAILAKAGETESITIATTYEYLGNIRYDHGDYDRAEGHYQRALGIFEQLLGPDQFHFRYLFVRRGRAAYDGGDYANAEAMFGRALAMTEKTFGPANIQLTPHLINLAMLYSTTGEYAKAEACYQRALSVHGEGLNDPSLQEIFFGLARLYAAQGRTSEAVEFQRRASELQESFIAFNLTVGSEREKLAFLDQFSWRSSRTVTLHTSLAPHDPMARELAVTTILRHKGRVQDAMSANLAALRLRSTTEDRALLDQLNETTTRLANLVLSAPQNTAPAGRQQQIQALGEQREKLEAEISRRSAGVYQPSQPATLAAVQRAVPDGAALIEFALYHPFDPKAPDNRAAYGEPHYVAYVVHGHGEVRWTALGAAKTIDDAVGAWRRALSDPRRSDVKRLARSVDAAILAPVRALLGETTQLLVSPDGALNLVPFEALVDERGRYLIERYSVRYLTSGRDLLRLQVARTSKHAPIVFADPLFGEPALTAIAKSTATFSPRAASGDTRPGKATRQKVTAGSESSSLYFAPLTGTAQEAQSIKSLFAEAKILTGAQATESALKQVAAPRVLHIATHGFFLTDAPASSASSSKASGASTRAMGARAKTTNPLLRSGLALAGANLRGSANDDGILTALEASGLNLWGTKLVTLSACDTAVGEVKNGEGVYGLRRAFVLAGTETLLMSLWPVSDYMTRELMVAYYKGLKQGQGRGAALRQVQLDLLKRKGRDHPFYWASFIQSGEWANLDGTR
jgi:CHAT domain-containing protein